MDMQEMGLAFKDIGERGSFREKIKSFKCFKEKPKQKRGTTWTQERREQHSIRIKEYWVKVKEKRNSGKRS